MRCPSFVDKGAFPFPVQIKMPCYQWMVSVYFPLFGLFCPYTQLITGFSFCFLDLRSNRVFALSQGNGYSLKNWLTNYEGNVWFKNSSSTTFHWLGGFEILFFLCFFLIISKLYKVEKVLVDVTISGQVIMEFVLKIPHRAGLTRQTWPRWPRWPQTLIIAAISYIWPKYFKQSSYF